MDPIQKQATRRLDALGWALFFIWLGIYLLFDFDRDGILAIGLGVIIVFENILRVKMGVPMSKFWQLMGGLFLAVGILDFFDLRLLPFLLVFCGAMILYRYVLPKGT